MFLSSERELMLDCTDNPYMPRHLQDVCRNLKLELDDLSVLHHDILPKFPPLNTDMIDGGYEPSSLVATPMHGDSVNEHLDSDDIDDNSSDSLESLEDEEFPSYFTVRGSPPRLFPSNGTYSLPVDGDEMKVCILAVGAAFNYE